MLNNAKGERTIFIGKSRVFFGALSYNNIILYFNMAAFSLGIKTIEIFPRRVRSTSRGLVLFFSR
jgi:hypothetical protein